jgi:type I restriction enzyme M protein
VSYDQIKEKHYSLNAGHYFQVRVSHDELTPAAFRSKMNLHMTKIEQLFLESDGLEHEIRTQMSKLKL